MGKHSSILTFLLLIILESILNGCNARAQKVRTTCENYARSIYRHSHKERVDLNRREITGIWTSSSCEAYSGPQFILRKYVIGQDGKWSANYYHYKDGWCSQPIFTVTMKGVFKIGGKNALGGHNGDFTAKSFLLTPHNEKAFIDLVKTSKQYCPRANLPTLQKNIKGEFIIPNLTNFTMRKDVYKNYVCRKTFGIHLYTHKIIKVLRDKHNGNINDKLYFGETPTVQTRRSYLPSSYHFPLSRSSSHCRICRRLESATASDVIRLSQPKKELSIEGEWISSTCQPVTETFMSRYFKFSPPDVKGQRRWKLVYYFFLDSACNVLSYKILARGTHTTLQKSKTIAGAYDVAFNLTDTEITPYEKLIAEMLRTEPDGTCGVTSKWRTGVTQSVKNTKGCRLFRISIPSVEYDVLKPIQIDNGGVELFTGQSSTDHIVASSPDKRASSFQLPLRRCKDLVTGDEEPKEKPTVRTPKTRKIKTIAAFTIPKDFFKTNPQSKPITDKDRNNPNTVQGDAHGNGKSGSLPQMGHWNSHVVAICALVGLLLIQGRG